MGQVGQPGRTSPTRRLAYGAGPHQWAEFRRPDTVDSVPLVVHFHGGFWRAEYTLDHARPYCAGLRRAGLATLNVEYPRVGQVGGGWPGTLTSARDALDLVGRLADDGVDPDRVAVSGHSAGGHLALLAAARADVDLVGVVPIAAVTDLRRAHERRLSDGGTAARDLVGGSPQQWPERFDLASPVERVPLSMPVVAVHGRHDDQVPIEQSRAYVRAARQAGGVADLVEVDADHFAVLDATTPMFDVVVGVLTDLVGGR